MGKIDSGSKSSRLLASRRYTHNTLTAAQESFTNVLDLQASEVYTQASKIPSSGLPYSGSSQKSSYYTVGSDNILKYWYRQKLTKSNVNNEVWFFLDPSGSDSGVGAQLINDNQEVNFVSPKYSTAALATSTTEDSTPGYLAVLYKSTSATSGSLSGDDIVSTNDYQFDYKTGVVQFMNSEVDPSNSEYVFMTVYQYVGKTLATGVEISGDISGSVSSTGSFGYLNVDGQAIIKGMANSNLVNVSSSYSTRVSNLKTDSGSFSTRVTDNNATGSILAGTGNIQGLGSTNNVQFNHITASSNISSSGNLYLSGTADIDGNVDIDNTTTTIDSSDAISLDAGAASNFTTTAGALTLEGKTGVDLKENGTSVITIDTNQDTLFASTGGSTSDPDVEFDGYVRHDGQVEVADTTDSTSVTTGALIVDGGVGIAKSLVVGGTVTAQEFHSQFVSASILYSSGSTKFGDTQDDNHEFTGSINQSGSFNLNTGNLTVNDNTTLKGYLLASGNITGSNNISASGNLSATGNLDIDGTANIAGNATLQSDLSVVDVNASGNITGSGNLEISGNISGSSASTGSFGALNIGAATLRRDSDGKLLISAGSTRVDKLEIDGASDYIDVENEGLQIISDVDIILNPGGNNVLPGGDSEDDLGVSGTAWRALYVDSIKMNGQGSIDGATHITGSGNLRVAGNISGSVSTTGSFGRTSTTTLDLTSIVGNWTNAGNTIADLGSVTTVDINGGTVDGITSLTAGGDLDIGAHDLRAATITADGLTSGRVVFAGTNGVLSDDADLVFSDATLTVTNIGATHISASGNITGSSVSASSGAFSTINVDGGTIDGITSLTAAGNLDIGSYDLQAQTLSADGLTADRVVFVHPAGGGLLTDDSDLTFSGATLSATYVNTTHVTASGNISASGTVYADNFQSTGGDSEGISFADDLNITGHITASGHMSASGNIYGLNITGSGLSIIGGGTVSSDSGSFGEIYVADNIYHTGNTDTYIGFPTGDKVDMKAGGINFFRAWQKDSDVDKFYFNYNQEEMDFIFRTANNNPGLKISGSGHVEFGGNMSGSAQSTGSFGRIDTDGDIYASGRLYEGGSSVVDHGTAMAIVFGG